MPRILVGGGNGQPKGNRMLHYERKTVNTGNLLASVRNMSGRNSIREPERAVTVDLIGAEESTRILTPLRAPIPQDDASRG